MDSDELRTGLDKLRSALNIVEMEIAAAAAEPSQEAVRALGTALNGVRTNVWAVLTAEHADDYDQYLAKVRVRRARETCEEVLADLYADTIPLNMPGLEVFGVTLRELSKHCAVAAEAAGEKTSDE